MQAKHTLLTILFLAFTAFTGSKAIASGPIDLMDQGFVVETLNTSLDSLDCESLFIYELDEPNLTAFFTDLSTGGDSLLYNWDFGDGNVSFEKDPVHTYSQPGTYTVCLTIITADFSCTSIFCETIQIGDVPCLAMWDYSAVGLTVFFGSESTGEIDTYLWDFGDGTTSTEPFAVHQYSGPGPWEVCLTISNSDTTLNCFDTYCETILLDTSFCQADFFYTVDDLTVTFENFSVGNNLFYLWYFGDENTSTAMNPVYTYAEPGIYGVGLFIEDTLTGCTSEYWYDIEVGNIPCEAGFEWFYSPAGAFEIYFSNTSTGTFTEVLWDFGDGTTSTEYNPVHSFPGVGEYDVCLSISNPEFPECDDTFCQQVVVDSIPCAASFTFDATDLTVSFTNTSNGGDPLYFWFFGDGNSSTDPNPVHTYEDPGYYEVCLTVLDIGTGFCYSFQCENIVVGDPVCNAEFGFFQNSLLTVSFFDQSNYPVENYFWDFGDGTTGTGPNPTHEYEALGTYTVCMTIENDSLGCNDTYCMDITLDFLDCDAAFDFEIEDFTVDFVNQSSGSDLLYFWDFGDGAISDLENPTHTYSESGIYDVTFMVTSGDGSCFDIANEAILIGESIGSNAYFKYEHMDPENVMFFDNSVGQVTNWHWDFGDGHTATTQHAQHQFTGPGTYEVCLTVHDMQNGQPSTFCREIVIETMTSVRRNTAFQTSVEVFPNPVTDLATVKLKLNESARTVLEVYNLTGQKMATLFDGMTDQGNQYIPWDAQGLEQGVYILQIRTNEQISTHKVVLQ
jgi:PKD repeat protein